MGSGGEGRRADRALLRIDGAEALDDLEMAVARLGDVHVHAHVVLAGHDGGGAPGALVDRRVIQSRDHVVLHERARFHHGSRPQAQPAVQARARATARELRVARIERVVLREQLLAERVADGLVVVEAAVEALDVGGRHHVQEVLVEVRADEMSAAAREAGVVQLLEERRDAGRHDRVEHDVRAAGVDPLDRRAVLHVVEREVLLADDRPAVGRDDVPHALVQHVGPDVVGRREVERLRPGLAHQPRDESIDLLCRPGAGAEDERIGLPALVLLRVDVERLALDHGLALDGLPRGAEDAAEDDVDVVLLDQLGSHRGRRGVVGRAVLETQLEVPPEQSALGVDVADDHPGDVGVGDARRRRAGRSGRRSLPP